MNDFDIFVANISWQGGGKRRPVLVVLRTEEIFKGFSITTQYENRAIL